MKIRSLLVRVAAFILAVSVGSAVCASCFGGTISADSEMACCKASMQACEHQGGPADCCKTAPQASQFTTVGKTAAAQPKAVPVHAVTAVFAEPSSLSHAWRLADSASPPGNTRPTFLVLSTLRL